MDVAKIVGASAIIWCLLTSTGCGRLGFPLLDLAATPDAASGDGGQADAVMDAAAMDATIVIPDQVEVGRLVVLGGDMDQWVNDVAVDDAGNLYAAGSFAGSTDFGGDVRVASTADDMYLATWDPSGALRWVRTFSSWPGNDQFSSVAVRDDRVFVCGLFGGPLDIGDGTMTPGGETDVFVAELTNSGTVLWSRAFGSPGEDRCDSVVVDSEGIYVGGSLIGTGTFDATTLPFLGGTNTGDGYLARFERGTGDYGWIRSLASSEDDLVFDLAMISEGSVHATGFVGANGEVDGSMLTGLGTLDIVVIELDGFGNVIQAETFGGPQVDEGAAIALSPTDGSRYVTGYFTESATFGTTDFTAGQTDAFLFKLADDGSLAWATDLGGPQRDIGRGIGVDGAGNVYASGVIFDGLTWGSDSFPSGGARDHFVISATPDGTPRWAVLVAGPGTAAGSFGFAVRPSGAVYLSGGVMGGASVRGQTIPDTGGWDAYILELVPSG